MDLLFIGLLVLLSFLAIVSVVVTFITVTIFSSAPWVPTSKKIARKMCEFGEIKKGYRVLDLGCGDATILVIAAKEFGAVCVGVELNPMVALMARVRVRLAGVQDSVKIVRENMFTVDLPDADVVMMYLLPKATHKIEQRLQDRYKNLTVISHGFELASKEVGHEKINGATVRKYRW